MHRRISCIAAIALALCVALPASAETSEQTFANFSEVLNRLWRNWQDTCPKPQLPSSVANIEEAEALNGRLEAFRSCVNRLAPRLERRTDAQPLVAKGVWDDLDGVQRSLLQRDLVRANRAVARELSDAFEEADRTGEAVIAEFVRRQEASMASVDKVRSCASRLQTLTDKKKKLESDEADLKSDELQLEMARTRMMGMEWMASKSDYNQAVRQFNASVDQLESKGRRYNKAVDALKSQYNDFESSCTNLRVSRKVKDEVCEDSKYYLFCSSLR